MSAGLLPAVATGLSDEQRLDWLRLIRSEKIGPRTFRTLINHFGGASAALDALPDFARKRGAASVAICSREAAEKEIAAAFRMGVRFIALGEPDYPAPLRQISDAPPLIGLRGGSDVLKLPAVAVVGSRNASAAGLRLAGDFARGLGQAGFAVVSGLARGIDAAAHQASLAAGTIAVLAGGQDRLYPAEHAPLVARIIDQGGAILTEMPMGWEPRGRDFPRRNRIVSGLAHGTLVVEAARRSGSLITARFANEQGREVFAVPGSPVDPRAEGTNDLIRQGATLVTSSDHIVEALQPSLGTHEFRLESGGEGTGGALRPLWDEWEGDELLQGGLPGGALPEVVADDFNSNHWHEPSRMMTNAADRVVALLSNAPVTPDELARRAEIPAREVQVILLDLELAGKLQRHGGGLVSLN